MTSKSGVDENQTMFGPGGKGAEQRKEWLDKYGYPRLVGTGGIFYSDQLSSDAEPSGGFNMGKSGSIWPVPKVVKEGQYGGSMGWGMKEKSWEPRAKTLEANNATKRAKAIETRENDLDG